MEIDVSSLAGLRERDSSGSSRPPTVSVVIPTRNRPELLRRAIRAALQQEYDGAVQVVVVYDHSEIDELLEAEFADITDARPERTLVVCANDRRGGLASARNCGILRGTHELVAFCDDDDEWLPGKLRRQVEEFAGSDAVLATTGVVVSYRGRLHERVLPADALNLRTLLRSRLTEAHPSSFLMSMDWIRSSGLVDEEIPGSYAEDYELLLRAARSGRLIAVEEPLVLVRWHSSSYFSDRWQTIVDAFDYLLAKYPEFRTEETGYARIQGQMAFACAALGNRPRALNHTRQALKSNPRELRGYLALAVCTRLVSATTALKAAHSVGKGI